MVRFERERAVGSKFRMNRLKPFIGGALLLLSFVVSCLFLFYNKFVDESDNLALGLFIAQGQVLYRDLFSHHFPLPYYWVAGITWLCGPSIFAIRLSLLLFRTLSLAWIMRCARFYGLVGVTALAWSLIGPLYYSQMLLYDNFSGIALVVVFAVVVAIVGRLIIAGWREVTTIGIFSAVAILADPQAIYPVGLALLALAVSTAGVKKSIVTMVIVGACLGFYLGYLGLAGAFSGFVRDAIFFNTTIYSRYTNTNILPSLLQNGATLLNILDVRWFNVNPFIPITENFPIDNWLFTGFLYRLAVILTITVFLARRKFLAAAFFYLFAVITLARGQEVGLHTIPFYMVSLLAAGGLISGIWWNHSCADNRPLLILRHCSRVVVGVMLAWLLIRGAGFAVDNRGQLSYEATFGDSEKAASNIITLTCGMDIALAHYPRGPLYNFLTGLRPVSRYVLLWPWVAEIALPEILDSLKSEQALVYLDKGAIAWNKYAVKDYAADLQTYLDKNYIYALAAYPPTEIPLDLQVYRNFYLSPQLATTCPNTWPETLAHGRNLTQTFVSQCPNLHQINLLFYANPALVTVRLNDVVTGQLIAEQTLSPPPNDAWQEFTFESVPDSTGRTYLLSISGQDNPNNSAVTMWRSRGDVYPAGELVVNGQPTNADLTFRYICGR
jgi:hypothetical protein